jgi:hypothetical protein
MATVKCNIKLNARGPDQTMPVVSSRTVNANLSNKCSVAAVRLPK